MHAMGVQEEAAFKASFALAGGLGLKQEKCGALTGGAVCLAMLSDKFGRSWDDFNKIEMGPLLDRLGAVGKWVDKCSELIGGDNCRTLTGIEIKTVADVEAYAASPNFDNCCRACAISAKFVVETLLEDD